MHREDWQAGQSQSLTSQLGPCCHPASEAWRKGTLEGCDWTLIGYVAIQSVLCFLSWEFVGRKSSLTIRD